MLIICYSMRTLRSAYNFLPYASMRLDKIGRSLGDAPVPDWDTRCRNTNAGGIGIDADAQQWKKMKNLKKLFWHIQVKLKAIWNNFFVLTQKKSLSAYTAQVRIR